MKLIPAVRDDIESLHLNQGKYLLAFSAGPDSVFLLLQLKEYFKDELPYHIALIYINYHDSEYVDEEEKIVNYYVDSLKLTLYKNDTKFDGNGNFEEWARDYRYNYFRTVCQKEKFQGLITAHQKTDVVETFLLQLNRNNLPTYYGLRKSNVLYGLKLYRPMLSVSKTQLTNQLIEENILFYDDITNKNLQKERNRLRTELTDESLLDQYISKINKMNEELKTMANTFAQYPYGMSWSVYDRSEDFKRRYCFFLLDKNNIVVPNREASGKLIYDFLKKQEPGIMKLNESLLLYRTNKEFFISVDVTKVRYSISLTEAKTYENEYIKLDLSDLSKFNLKHLPAEVRNFHPGDTIATDLPNKDVKKFLQKQGVPYYLIPIYPVFVCEDKIQCVPFYKDIQNQLVPLTIKSIKGKLKL